MPNDPDENDRIDALGREYARGRMPLENVAVRTDSSDAIALLQQRGHSRSLQAITLEEQARSQMFEQMDRDRRERRGEPEYDRGLVERDVIASERLEGVDARAWIRRSVE